jgi:5-methylcytosine-specific restriction endonuclease McrA
MANMDYQEQLKDRRWIELRDSILIRDWNMCQQCMRTVNLHVHHKRYYPGRMAWEYDKWDLITLCDKCHRAEHGIPEKGEANMSDPFVRLPILIGDLFRYVAYLSNKRNDG